MKSLEKNKTIKKPCKICLQSVSKKNGLQCQGACQKWAHYKCLCYTQRKIDDIKHGIIKITCPCPDCNTSLQIEESDDPLHSCKNLNCPTPVMPKYLRKDCPQKDPIPSYPISSRDTPTQKPSFLSKSSGSESIETSLRPSFSNFPPPIEITTTTKNSKECQSRHPTKTCSPIKFASRKCSQQTCDTMDSTCGSQYLSKSCCLLSSLQPGIDGKSNSSDCIVHNMVDDQKDIITTIEHLCGTVGQLAQQLNDLMCKINHTKDLK